MSDLISRDALIKELEDMCNGQLIGNPNVTYVSFGDVIDKVFEQPTVFDVEKVVEQLEDRKSQLLKEFVLKDKAQTVKENAISRMNEIDGCIEIVKRGGIDG